MPLNSQLTLSFQNAAKSIFDSMVSSENLGYVSERPTIDKVTQVSNSGDCAAVRLVVLPHAQSRFYTGQGDTYKLGDTIAYVLVEEVPFVINIGDFLNLPFDSNLNLIDPNNDCVPDNGDIIVAGNSQLLNSDFVIAGDSNIQDFDEITLSFKEYVITTVDVDDAEAAYRLGLRLK